MAEELCVKRLPTTNNIVPYRFLVMWHRICEYKEENRPGLRFGSQQEENKLKKKLNKRLHELKRLNAWDQMEAEFRMHRLTERGFTGVCQSASRTSQ